MLERRFKATLERPDTRGSWTYLDIPFDVERAFGRKGRVKVKGTISGCAWGHIWTRPGLQERL